MRLSVASMGAAGDGIARDDSGAPVFIPFSLPGEVVRVTPGERRGDGRSATLEAVEVPSPDRVVPPCPHFGTCGACVVQHWADPAFAAWKAARVVEALGRAGFPDVAVPPAVVSAPNTRRRADLAMRRTGGGIVVGFHARGSREPFDLHACFVLDPRLLALVAPLRDLARRLSAFRRAGSAVVNLLDTGADLLLRTDGVPTAADRAVLAAFGAANGIPRIAWAAEGGREAPEVAAQSGPVSIALSGVAVAPPAGAFLQATPEGEAAIVAAVLDGLPRRMPPRAPIVELHAGLGTLTFALARRGRVVAHEGAAEAVAALRAAGAARVTATRRDLARQPLLPPEIAGSAAVVLDPPYAGAAEQVPVLARAATRVVYVSCNPTALARDAAAFARAPGWRVERAVAVDQFRWSSSVEAVVTFARD
ncbi:class I SAM-dependent RNA methyltransferase [Roseomonas sp. CCTCC AB2023176]|uniref:class I SAM-dependent RNA methyltransferase n=1 Tax=Roseomonas sp. CCTCC AB2023176 TaxID=3342640 RepID=UPI0035DD5B4D